MGTPQAIENALNQARKVFKIEAAAILDLENRLNDHFILAVKKIVECQGKIILTGIGKSGQIARKIASTFSSTGTPAIYLHPSESAHGDLGVISEKDLILAISYGGNSKELENILRFASRKAIPLIAMTAQLDSMLAKAGQIVLDIHVKEEACPLNLAPTASSAATLAMGDALAMAALVMKGFRAEDFAEYHPGGSLGFRLLTQVKDVMHSGKSLPMVQEKTPVKEVIRVMTEGVVRGLAVVVNSSGDLIGVITDGDVRRALDKFDNILTRAASEIMGKNPKVIDSEVLVEKAIHEMEQNRVQSLVVLSQASGNKPVGAINFQDLLMVKAK